MMRQSRTETLALGWYRLMLRFYRRVYLAELGQELEETFLDRYRAARKRGFFRAIRFLPAAGWDAIANGIIERIEHRRAQRLEVSPTSYNIFYWQDIKYAVRQLAKNPGFASLTVVVLGAGLGLSIFTYSFLHTAMIKPLPVDDGAAVVRIMTMWSGGAGDVDAADLTAMRPNIRTLTDVGAYTTRQVIIGANESSRVVSVVGTEWNIFETTRTKPHLGRGFRPADGEKGAEPVVVLSHWAWRALFGRDATIIDTKIDINAVRTRVIGVMPEEYGFPVAARIWLPIDPDLLETTDPDRNYLGVYARKQPGVGDDRVNAELNVLFSQVRADRPVDVDDEGPVRALIRSYPMAQMGEEGPLVFTILNVLAGLILLLACINVTNLLMARANERVRETAVRLALGAPRARLVMQSMWESVLLCLAGGVLATWGAAWGLDRVNAWAQLNLEGNLAFWWVWEMNRSTLVGAGVLVTLAIAVLGGVVSYQAASTKFNAVLHDGTTGAGSRREGRVARVLVVTQVVTVSILMFVGGMSAIIAHRVLSLDLGGYETTNILFTDLDLPEHGYEAGSERVALYRSVHHRLTEQREIESVVLRARIANIDEPGGEFVVEAASDTAAATVARSYVRAILGPMTTMGLKLLEGRHFDATDRANGPRTIIVSASLARRYWPSRSSLGDRIRVGEEEEWRTVVGVMSDVLLGNPLTKDRSPMVTYLPLAQTTVPEAGVTFKHTGNRDAASAAIHRVLTDIDPLVAPTRIESIEEILEKTGLLTRSTTKLFLSCFAFALLLAVCGIYGLMSRSITQRTREIGVRRALGATDAGIVRLLVGEGGRQLGIGAVIALPITWLIGLAFSRLVIIETSLAMVTAVVVSVSMIAIVLAATYVPTRRAVAIEPREALWQD